MKKNTKQMVKNVFYALAVAVFGFILLNLTFIFDAFYQGLVRGFIGLFVNLDLNMDLYWFSPLMHFSFVVVIGLISWFIFKSKLKSIYKAIFMTVPLAVVFATIGMFLYSWTWAVYLIGILFFAGVFYYLCRTKQPWIYYYTLILISFLMFLVALLGVEI